MTKPVLLAVHQILSFWEPHPQDRVLEIGYSQEAIHLLNALLALPNDCKGQVIAIAVGPAALRFTAGNAQGIEAIVLEPPE